MELETRLPRNASHICAAAAAENSVFVMGADFSGKVRVTMIDNKFLLLKGFLNKIDVDSDSKWRDLPSLKSSDAGCMADADEFG